LISRNSGICRKIAKNYRKFEKLLERLARDILFHNRMGCDGGSIPRREELVKLKKKAEKVDPIEVERIKWFTCAMSEERLKEPIVVLLFLLICCFAFGLFLIINYHRFVSWDICITKRQ
jgi:hypothetical protein